MKVLVLAEYYPRTGDPVLGIWAHRQALAARDAGAEVRVLVLHRPLPSLSALRRGDAGAARAALAQPHQQTRDGLIVDYLRYLAPPRPWSYASWGAWAAPVLRRALGALRLRFAYDLVHAHYAVPAGDAIRRAQPGMPVVVSVHGGDVLGAHARHLNVAAALRHARLVLANSAGTARRCTALGARATRVVHLGADLAPDNATRGPLGSAGALRAPTLVTVGNLIARKRHADVIAALPALAARHPGIRYEIIGDGPQRAALAAQARELGVAGQVTLYGALPHAEAVAAARRATLFVLPSVDEAFGVAYVEAMAAGVPAVGVRGEDGPEEIAACGGGIVLVAPRDPAALAAEVGALLSAPERVAALGAAARATVEAHFTWGACGRDTVRAYEDALA
ncbi:MAG: glycosyltransferase [Solirubrobacteraceae bacterium]